MRVHGQKEALHSIVACLSALAFAWLNQCLANAVDARQPAVHLVQAH